MDFSSGEERNTPSEIVRATPTVHLESRKDWVSALRSLSSIFRKEGANLEVITDSLVGLRALLLHRKLNQKCVVAPLHNLMYQVRNIELSTYSSQNEVLRGASTGLQIGGGIGVSGGNNAPMNGGGLGGLTNILSQIDLPGLLQGVNSFVKLVGVFCPPLSQVLDNVIQNVTSTAFRVFGRAILQGGGLGGGGNGGGQKVSVVLPTFPPDEDDEDYEDDEDETSSTAPNAELVDRSENSESDSSSEAPKEAMALSAENEVVDSTTEANNKNDKENSPAGPLFTSPVNDESNLIAKRHVRVTREVDETDQEGAESAPVPEDLSDVDEDGEDRNKRFLPFGGSADGHASGGSGNFLFDIIRLVAGSGATEEADEKANAPGGVVEVDVQKSGDGHYTEGIPGPITRLFVIANRGVANLVQDLILRLAQTSERLVNFKARLITALI
ncbi:hypothetical protein JTB14_029381 [Gonioctena quinquepunctata]|nr:hypothetical protein JTB14_029381 [Gonioctena quinquepunctata]